MFVGGLILYSKVAGRHIAYNFILGTFKNKFHTILIGFRIRGIMVYNVYYVDLFLNPFIIMFSFSFLTVFVVTFSNDTCGNLNFAIMF